MKFGDVPDEEILDLLSGRTPMPVKSEWEVAVDILRVARLPLRRGMLLVNGWVVVRGEDGHEPRGEQVPLVRVARSDGDVIVMGVSGTGWGAKGMVPDIRDPWTARMVWHDLNARFAGEDRSKTPDVNQILTLIVATGGYEKLTMAERKERHVAVVEEQQKAAEAQEQSRKDGTRRTM